MNIRSYNDMRGHITGKNIAMKVLLEKYGTIPEDYAEFWKKEDADFKKDCREFYRYVMKYHVDPLSVPILNDKKVWRTVSTDNGESCTDFIIIPDKGQTDEDIEDFVHTTVYCPKYSYDYSTGRVVTFGFSYRRIKAGILVIHERGIDW